MRAGRPEPTALRRGLRAARTEAERPLRYGRRDRRLRGYKFVRQEAIGRYGADFCCREACPIVEIDGGQHADSAQDRARDAWLTAQGNRVLRFWNAEALNNTLSVVDTVLAALPPTPRTESGLPDVGPPVPIWGKPEIGRGVGRDDAVVGAMDPKGEGEGAAPEETRPEPPPHPRLPPRCDDRVVASLSPQAGRGEIHA